MQADAIFRTAEIHMARVMVGIVGAQVNSSVAGDLGDERSKDHPRIHAVAAMAGIFRLDVSVLGSVAEEASFVVRPQYPFVLRGRFLHSDTGILHPFDLTVRVDLHREVEQAVFLVGLH